MEGFLQVQHGVARTVGCHVLVDAGLERSDFGDLQRGVGEDVKLGLNRLVLVPVSIVVVVSGVRHRDLGLAGHDVRKRAGDGEEAVGVGDT